MSVPVITPSPGSLPAAALRAPWWQPYRGLLATPNLAHLPTDGSVAARLNALAVAGGGAPVRFVDARALPAGQAYEAFIRASGQVPTRDNWHDLLNGLVWLRLPRTKQRLNELQAFEIARAGVQARRGLLRDAATVFDENAALLHAPDALWAALAARRWAALFGPLRPLWAQARLLVFGHAALEKLLAPYKSITVHVWRVAQSFEPAGELGALDHWLADDLDASKLATKPFAPLPLLGVPGWWAGNEAPGFYDDAEVFRPPRRGD